MLPPCHGRGQASMPLACSSAKRSDQARALAYQEERSAKRMENPDMRGPIENTVKRAATLAERFERARHGVL